MTAKKHKKKKDHSTKISTKKKILKKKTESTQEPTSKETKSKKSSPNKFSKLKFSSRVGFIIFIVFILGFLSFFIYRKLTQPQPIAELLPANKTLAFVELNISPSLSQSRELKNLIERHPNLSEDLIKSQLEEMFKVDIDKDITPWLGRRIAVAFIERKEKAYTEFSTIGFIETNDQEKTIQFLKTLSLENEKDQVLNESSYRNRPVFEYKISHNIHFSFINDYLVFAFNEEDLKSLIDAQYSPTNMLAATAKFHKVRNNLPSNNLAFVYSDFQQTLKALNHNPVLLQEKSQQLRAYNSYLKTFKSIGFAFVADSPSLNIQQFAYLDKEALPEESLTDLNEKYSASLSALAEKNVTAFAGGQNLFHQIQALLEVLTTNENASNAAFEGFLHNQVARYFGSDIGLREHIYPLLKGEYAIIIGASEKQPDYKILLELTEPEKDTSRLVTILQSFQQISTSLAPKLVEVELPDGTKAQELVANPEAVTTSSANYKDQEIKSINLEDKPWGVHYSIVSSKGKEIAIMASQLESVKSSIDALNDPASSFTNSTIYKDSSSHLSNADEIALVNLQFLPLKDISPLLGALKYGLVSKNYFEDGISTIFTITLK